MKLAPKKCYFLRKSVKFLGHIVDEHGVLTDPDKVQRISSMTVTDLMEADGVTPSEKRAQSFLCMLNFYQHFQGRLLSTCKGPVLTAGWSESEERQKA